jgi:hypothetical protein
MHVQLRTIFESLLTRNLLSFRFPALHQGLRLKTHSVCPVIAACIKLNNEALALGLPDFEDDLPPEVEVENAPIDVGNPAAGYRDLIVQRHFTV